MIFASGFSIRVISNYLMADLNNKKNANSYKIGIFTITMVITFVMIIWSTLTYSNRIFLKLAQNSAGESDFQLTPISTEDISFSGDYYA